MTISQTLWVLLNRGHTRGFLIPNLICRVMFCFDVIVLLVTEAAAFYCMLKVFGNQLNFKLNPNIVSMFGVRLVGY